jgi:hypothetical protein
VRLHLPAVLTKFTTMKRIKHRLPIPQHEFGFAPDTFNLFQQSTLDGDRLARERAQADEARRLANTAQARLFAPQSAARV